MYIGVSTKVHVWIITTSIPKWKVHYSVRGGNIYIAFVWFLLRRKQTVQFSVKIHGFVVFIPRRKYPVPGII